jgi:phosphatidylserine/phosphatidylglycerophosphate/cardiolipin synthase-like enzyme
MHRISRLGLALSAVLCMVANAQDTAQAASQPSDQQATSPAPAADQQIAQPPSDAPPADTSSTPADHKPVVRLPAVVKHDGPSAAGPKHQEPAIVSAQGADATPKQQAAAAAEVTNPAAPSGFRLMTLSTNALLSRVSLADQAKHTIDLQYFIFNNDATGRLIALHLLQAAERGVHVRMLLDDFNMGDDARMFQALAANPNIEVRLFNPFHSASPGPISKAAQMLTQFERLNHRMHN